MAKPTARERKQRRIIRGLSAMLIATIVMIALQSWQLNSPISDRTDGVTVQVMPQQSDGPPALFLRPL
jgi:hypothetical protein